MTATWKPRTLILQHEAPTPPGLMSAWLHEQNPNVDTLRIDEEDWRLTAALLTQPPHVMRIGGLVAAAAGVGLVWLIRG